MMDLESLSQKQLNQLELCVRELLAAMRKARVHDEPLVTSLKVFEDTLAKIRRERFDAANSEFSSY